MHLRQFIEELQVIVKKIKVDICTIYGTLRTCQMPEMHLWYQSRVGL
jgi:hypothetical protein